MNTKEQISLAAGVIVEKNQSVLMVYEHGRWGLPKGERNLGESMSETAIREAYEETGLRVTLKDVAFVTEFSAKTMGFYLQVFYHAEVAGGSLQIMDPDNEIEKVDYIHQSKVREKMTFRPRLLPLEHWLNTKQKGYYSYDLNIESPFV
ncbi:MAG TPA: NUDIX hydrolase [Pseudogracilibacillus sp.]|nr:NUDIX hydrolase [Pseudogracilibacillus sp.]